MEYGGRGKRVKFGSEPERERNGNWQAINKINGNGWMDEWMDEDFAFGLDGRRNDVKKKRLVDGLLFGFI